MEGDERKKALSIALANIEKQFGKGAIMRMADDDVNEDIDVVSTGSLGLDLALGVGGLPRGRIIEIFGPESSGKTTLALSVISTPLTCSTRSASAWCFPSCSSRSPIRASRRSRSPMRSCARARST
jgi:hypothetical protein